MIRVKRGASHLWSFGPTCGWGSIETTTNRKTNFMWIETWLTKQKLVHRSLACISDSSGYSSSQSLKPNIWFFSRRFLPYEIKSFWFGHFWYLTFVDLTNSFWKRFCWDFSCKISRLCRQRKCEESNSRNSYDRIICLWAQKYRMCSIQIRTNLLLFFFSFSKFIKKYITYL